VVNAIGWGVGIAGVGAGVVMLVVGRTPAKHPPSVGPLILPGGGGGHTNGRQHGSFERPWSRRNHHGTKCEAAGRDCVRTMQPASDAARTQANARYPRWWAMRMRSPTAPRWLTEGR